jgi:hypothetical protein
VDQALVVFRQLKTLIETPMAGLAVAVVLGATMLVAAPASAQSCKAPPGTSAIDEYCEAIPSPSGDRGSTDSDRGGLPIPAATRRALEKAGADGRSIVKLSASATKRKRPAGDAAAAKASGEAGPASGNVIDALAAGVGEGGTVGPLFGTLLLFLALVFASLGWLRYRRGGQV